ncbi:hypothetical protein E2C01_006719 [Portunus trituberculatus]|uniref:Transmembrane protein n=1 Tax=Portunus trituberculatus TaxID=210409 RepID=A0A5B7CVV2_PORTR|nr:hypothetical protein [Portunus trituberculatus]
MFGNVGVYSTERELLVWSRGDGLDDELGIGVRWTVRLVWGLWRGEVPLISYGCLDAIVVLLVGGPEIYLALFMSCRHSN